MFLLPIAHVFTYCTCSYTPHALTNAHVLILISSVIVVLMWLDLDREGILMVDQDIGLVLCLHLAQLF